MSDDKKGEVIVFTTLTDDSTPEQLEPVVMHHYLESLGRTCERMTLINLELLTAVPAHGVRAEFGQAHVNMLRLLFDNPYLGSLVQRMGVVALASAQAQERAVEEVQVPANLIETIKALPHVETPNVHQSVGEADDNIIGFKKRLPSAPTGRGLTDPVVYMDLSDIPSPQSIPQILAALAGIPGPMILPRFEESPAGKLYIFRVTAVRHTERSEYWQFYDAVDVEDAIKQFRQSDVTDNLNATILEVTVQGPVIGEHDE